MPGSTFELVIEEERRDNRSAALPVRLSVNAAHALMNILRVFCYGLRRQRKRLRDHRQGGEISRRPIRPDRHVHRLYHRIVWDAGVDEVDPYPFHRDMGLSACLSHAQDGVRLVGSYPLLQRRTAS